MIETLFCAQGNHPFQRETTRGRKPTLCPDHRKATSPKATDPSDDTKVDKVYAPKIKPDLEQRVLRILGTDRINYDSKLKLRYAYEAVQANRGSVGLMLEVIQNIVRQEEYRLALQVGM
jgi:hypothetical protein